MAERTKVTVCETDGTLMVSGGTKKVHVPPGLEPSGVDSAVGLVALREVEAGSPGELEVQVEPVPAGSKSMLATSTAPEAPSAALKSSRLFGPPTRSLGRTVIVRRTGYRLPTRFSEQPANACMAEERRVKVPRSRESA